MTSLNSYQQLLRLLKHDNVIVIAKAAILLIAGFFLAKYASKFAEKISARYFNPHQNQMFKRIVFYIIFILFLLSALQHLGFSLNIFLGATGIVTLALGFAAQTSAANLISGLFLLMEKPFKIGETISLDTISGHVYSIDLLSIKLCTSDNQFVRIPNEVLIKSTIVNLSRFDNRRINILLNIDFQQDFQSLREKILEIIHRHEQALKDPLPDIYVSSFGENSISVQINVWCEQQHCTQVKNDISLAIQQLFQQKVLIRSMSWMTARPL